MSSPRSIRDAITVDEIGIETGHYGPFLLKTVYQPIFETGQDGLAPIGAEGLIKPFVEGKSVPALDFFAQVPAEDGFFVENMCRALHLRNYRNIGVEGLQLFFNYDPRAHTDLESALGQIRYMASRLEYLEIDPADLVCEITEVEAVNSEMLVEIAAEMRRHGVRLAVDDFGTGHSTLQRMDLIEADIVKIDGPWFRQIATMAAARRLLEALVRALQRSGRQVLIEGIETPDQLKAALDTGADLLQGFLLGRPALAGTIFDTNALDPDDFFYRGDNVIRLFR